VGCAIDITDLERTQEQVLATQKLESLGVLAGGIAHDFNNLLTVIKGYAELAQTRELRGEAAYEVSRIVEAANKAAMLTRQLLAFSRRQVLQPRNIVLNNVVTALEPMLRPMLRENVQLVFSPQPDLGTVYADPAQMEQVLMNLASNARDAMPNGGQLRIDLRNLDLPTPYAERNIQIPTGRYVMLAVADTGTGIAPDTLHRIFEPFFTTKEVGRGTGLGLSTVYGIVRQSGGYIWAYSELDMGTTFKICLPRVDRAADVVAVAPAAGTQAARGGETVLLVEDDASLRELAEKILERYGYRVVTASSGEEGFQRGHEHANEIHLLLTDLVMTKSSGKELAERLRACAPSLKVIYMSGYPYSTFSDTSTVDFRESFLPKPFSPSELASKVRETLDRA
jgi:nitrogen-specific signal transduction histidine kinase